MSGRVLTRAAALAVDGVAGAPVLSPDSTSVIAALVAVDEASVEVRAEAGEHVEHPRPLVAPCGLRWSEDMTRVAVGGGVAGCLSCLLLSDGGGALAGQGLVVVAFT